MKRAYVPNLVDRLFVVLTYVFISFIGLCCVIPFVLVLSGSFTSESAILTKGFGIFPVSFSLDAYRLLMGTSNDLVRAYGVTIMVTVIGTASSVFLMAMAAYVLQRKDFFPRHSISFFIYLTTILSGGLIPWYILISRYLHMKNSLFVLIVPSLFNVFYMIILRSFMSTIPDSLTEAAKIDGAGNFRIFIQLILPLSKPALATMTLFVALAYWNDWFLAMLFVEKTNLQPLQYYLYSITSKLDFLRNVMSGQSIGGTAGMTMPNESFKMATTIVTIGPIILLYPYLQKYFVKGIMIGAIKG